MRAGAMDERAQVRRASLIDDGFGLVETWADLGAPVSVERVDVSDGERWRAGAVGAQITTRFRMWRTRFTAGITPKDRLICNGREYDITGIKDMDRPAILEITAAARADG